jgi:hypothetical protein
LGEVPDQRSLLRGRLATVIDGVSDVAARLDPPAARPVVPSLTTAAAGRLWTIAAAMEPIAAAHIEPVAAPGTQPRVQTPDVAYPTEPPAHHRFPAAMIGAGVIGLIVILAIGLRLLPASRTTPPAVTAQIALTAVRPVASSASAGDVIPPTQISFPAGTSTVSIDVNSGGKAGQAPVEILVRVGQPAQTLIDHEYVLDTSGDTLIALTPASGTYAPGNYTVTIISNGARLGATTFEVR